MRCVCWWWMVFGLDGVERGLLLVCSIVSIGLGRLVGSSMFLWRKRTGKRLCSSISLSLAGLALKVFFRVVYLAQFCRFFEHYCTNKPLNSYFIVRLVEFLKNSEKTCGELLLWTRNLPASCLDSSCKFLLNRLCVLRACDRKLTIFFASKNQRFV